MPDLMHKSITYRNLKMIGFITSLQRLQFRISYLTSHFFRPLMIYRILLCLFFLFFESMIRTGNSLFCSKKKDRYKYKLSNSCLDKSIQSWTFAYIRNEVILRGQNICLKCYQHLKICYILERGVDLSMQVI